MNARIAILTSTRPVCRETTRPGRTAPKRVIDLLACSTLGQKYDLIIIGSGASDKVYDRIAQGLPAGIRKKFRFYSRTYFDNFAGSVRAREENDEFNAGWQGILKANKIFFLPEREVVHEDFSTSLDRFDWKKMDQFINDERVELIVSSDQFM